MFIFLSVNIEKLTPGQCTDFEAYFNANSVVLSSSVQLIHLRTFIPPFSPGAAVGVYREPI